MDVLFQTLDETERGAGGFGSTGRNWKIQTIVYVLKIYDMRVNKVFLLYFGECLLQKVVSLTLDSFAFILELVHMGAVHDNNCLST